MKLKAEVAYQVVDGQVVAVSAAGDRVYLLDAVATEMWKKLEGGVDKDGVTEVEREFAAFLAGKGLLEDTKAGALPETHPWLVSEEPVEVMAALCDSARLGGGGSNPGQGPPNPPPGHTGKCRAFGTCQLPFE